MGAENQSGLSLLEAVDLISCTTILGFLYGVVFVLYCLCARLLYLQLQEPDKRGQAMFTLVYISLVLLCTTAYLVLETRMIQLAYINHANFPGGPLGYQASYNPTTNFYEMTSSIFDSILEVSTIVIQIWRLWIIWSGTRHAVAVVVPPLLLLLSYLALNILIGVASFLLSPSDQLGISSRSYSAMIIANYAVLSGVTTLVTGLVIGRILLVRKHYVKIFGVDEACSYYMNIVSMLIESYALDSAWSVGSAISFGLDSPAVYLFLANDSIVKVIAYFLVVYRVASGRGWTRKTGSMLTTLQWNHGGLETTADSTSDIRSRTPADMTVVAVGSPLMLHSASTV